MKQPGNEATHRGMTDVHKILNSIKTNSEWIIHHSLSAKSCITTE